MFAFVLSALLCCAFFTGCSSTPAPNNPNKTANNAPDYVNNFLQSDKYIGMSGDDLQAEGFILQDSVGTSSSSIYEKTISSVFSIETDVTVASAFFVTYLWSLSDPDETLEQAEEINRQFIEKLDTPTCKYNEKSIDYNSNVLSSAFSKSGDFDLELTYHGYYIDGYKAPFFITFSISYHEHYKDSGIDPYRCSLYLSVDYEAMS